MDQYIVLCVDDDGAALHELRALLAGHLGPDHLVEAAKDGAEALAILADLRKHGRELSVVVCGGLTPELPGDAFLARLHALSGNTVAILLTGQLDPEAVRRAVNDAALYRWLDAAGDAAELVLTVRAAVQAYRQRREVEELRTVNQRLERLVEERSQELATRNTELARLAITDSLTGLCNRIRLDEVLDAEWARSQRYASSFALVLLDIDRFKAVNDTHGHLTGDQVLVTMAGILTASTREVDTVGRWGGEEFLIIASGSSIEGAMELAEKLRVRIAAHPFPVVGGRTASFGVTAFRPGDTITTLMARVDAALYRAKEGGRNRVVPAA